MSTLSIHPSGSWNTRDLFKFLPKAEKTALLTLRETRDCYLVHIELPGYIKDDIHIKYHEGTLSIEASSYFAARRVNTLKLEKEVEEAQIRSLYERNMLKIWLPKKTHKSKRFGIFSNLTRSIRRLTR